MCWWTWKWFRAKQFIDTPDSAATGYGSFSLTLIPIKNTMARNKKEQTICFLLKNVRAFKKSDQYLFIQKFVVEGVEPRTSKLEEVLFATITD